MVRALRRLKLRTIPKFRLRTQQLNWFYSMKNLLLVFCVNWKLDMVLKLPIFNWPRMCWVLLLHLVKWTMIILAGLIDFALHLLSIYGILHKLWSCHQLHLIIYGSLLDKNRPWHFSSFVIKASLLGFSVPTLECVRMNLGAIKYCQNGSLIRRSKWMSEPVYLLGWGRDILARDIVTNDY